MRVLICTHHFHEWAGSELLTLEIFEDLTARDLSVDVFCPFVDLPFAHLAFGNWLRVQNNPAKVRLRTYDLVIVLHQTASRFLHLQEDAALSDADRPFFAYFHLSPTEPFEAPGLFAQRHLADAIFANSVETRDALTQYGFNTVDLFENPAPAAFETSDPPPETLRRLLSVSNHVPPELERAFDILSRRGVEIYRIGKPSNPRRVQPYDLRDHDAVVTIGKTVQYGFRARRPLYCYDHFQGPGWIGTDFARSAAANFSGRCHPGHRTPEALADDIVTGYADARLWAMHSPEAQSSVYRLEAQLDALIERVRMHRPRQDRVAGSVIAEVRTNLRLEARIYAQVDAGYQAATGMRSPAVAGPADPPPDTYPVTSHHLRTPENGEPMVVAAFSFRHDAHLVPGLLENIGPAIHAYVAWDDRAADENEVFSDETTRQTALFRAARDLGAQWLLAVDPDERFEDRLACRIRSLTSDFGPVVWTFQCREMFDPTSYRIDGIWGLRERTRLFPCLPGMEPDQHRLHGYWTQNGLGLETRPSGLNFYHLRTAAPVRRSLRHRQYARIDPHRESQTLGYDYLDDERGMVLQEIPPGRGYSPVFEDDGEPWQPSAPSLLSDPVVPDPTKSRLHLLKATWAKGGHENAAHLARDLCAGNPGDQELALWAADSAMRAGLWDMAGEMAEEVAKTDPESLMARSILARTHIATGDQARARTVLAEAEALAPQSLFLSPLRDALHSAPDRFEHPDALWRRWADGAARIHEGDRIPDADMVAVVLSLGAPPELADAVRSLCAQSVPCEIVVVNSGGGDVLGRLADMADRLRIITTDTRLYAGAARNIGIDASCGPHVSFLAADCLAVPDSLGHRLRLHRSGYRAVQAQVGPVEGAGITERIGAYLLHSSRMAGATPVRNQAYSLSYDRAVFEEFGYFATGLRIGEDTYLNRALAGAVEIGSDESIRLTHRYATDRDALDQDIVARARRRVHSLHFPLVGSTQALRQHVNNGYDVRYRQACEAIEQQEADLDPVVLEKIRDGVARTLELERKASYRAGLEVIEARKLQRAARAARRKDRGSAFRLASEAHALFPELPSFALTMAEVLGPEPSAADLGAVIAALHRAASVDPGNPHVLLSLMDCLMSAGDDLRARRAFERACIAAPRNRDVWARHAPLPGDPGRPMRVFALQRMFFLDPFDAGTTETLAENYRHARKEAASAARRRFAGLLW